MGGGRVEGRGWEGNFTSGTNRNQLNIDAAKNQLPTPV